MILLNDRLALQREPRTPIPSRPFPGSRAGVWLHDTPGSQGTWARAMIGGGSDMLETTPRNP